MSWHCKTNRLRTGEIVPQIPSLDQSANRLADRDKQGTIGCSVASLGTHVLHPALCRGMPYSVASD